MKRLPRYLIFQSSVLSALILVSPDQTRAPNAASRVDDVDRTVVKIESPTKTGTGVVVCVEGDTASILTAAHVVENDDTVEISISPRADLTYRARVTKRDLDGRNGLALVVLRGEAARKLRKLDIDTVDAKKDDKVFTVGFPASSAPWAHMPGQVSGIDGPTLKLSNHTEEGNSGGPVIGERTGKAVGLVMRQQSGLGHAIPASTVRATLAGWGIADCGVIEMQFGGSACEPYQPRFYQNRGGTSPDWVSDGASLVGTSLGKSTTVESYYVCSYSLPRPVRSVTLNFLGASVDFSAPEGTGGGLGLLVYAGRPDMDLGTWGNHGSPKFSRWWAKESPTIHIDARPEEYNVDFDRATDSVSVVVLLGDAWASQTVRTQIRGINIKLE